MARFIIVLYSSAFPGIRREMRKELDDMERAISYATDLLSQNRKRLAGCGLACDRWLVFHVKHPTHAVEWAQGMDRSHPSTKDKPSSTRKARRERIGIGGSVASTRARPIRIGTAKAPRKMTKLMQVVAEAKQRRSDNESIRPVGGNPHGQI